MTKRWPSVQHALGAASSACRATIWRAGAIPMRSPDGRHGFQGIRPHHPGRGRSQVRHDLLPGHGGRGRQPRAGARRAHPRQALAHRQARADGCAGGPGDGDEPHRPGRDRDHDLQRALQHRPALRLDRPYQPRPRRLEPGDVADRGRIGEFRLRRAPGACRALRARRRILRGRHRPVGQLGRRRSAARQAERRLHGPRQGPLPRSRGQALQGQGAAQHHPLAAGLAGGGAGGLVRSRTRARRTHRRRGVHRPDENRRGEGLLRRHQEPRRALRPGTRRHQDHAGPHAGARPHHGRGARELRIPAVADARRRGAAVAVAHLGRPRPQPSSRSTGRCPSCRPAMPPRPARRWW